MITGKQCTETVRPDGESCIWGRIVKGVGGIYTVAAETGRYACNVRGIFRKHEFTPAVGDYVYIELVDEDKKTGTITRFAERKTELVRPRVANIDQAIVVFAAARPAINADTLDRFLLLAEERGLDIIICINKIDLNDCNRVLHEYTTVGYPVLGVSAETGEGTDALSAALSGRVSVFAGPSGVGKSSLINLLLADERMQTGELSHKSGRGKHTTRHTELIEAYPGAFVVDTPGFTSLSLEHIALERLDGLFREFRPYLGQCRFNDCRHMNEPGCAVKAHLGNGMRYLRYTIIMSELKNR